MGVDTTGGVASSVSSPTHLHNHSSIMKLLVVLTVVGVALSAPVEKSVAIHAATLPIATSYTAAASPLLSLGHAFAPAISPLTYNAPAISPLTYNLPATNLVHTYAAPSVYRIPTPVVYRAPAPAPIVVQAPPKVIVKTIQAPAPAPIVVQAPPKVIVKTVEVPAPAPAPIIKTVFVDASTEDSDEE